MSLSFSYDTLLLSLAIAVVKDSFDMNRFQKYHFTWLIIFVSFLVFIESFTPVERIRQSIALVGNKLYFFGGQTAFLPSTKDVFYLDVSPLQLNTLNPPWTDISKTAPITVNSSYVSACVGGSVNNSVFLLEFHGKDNAVSSVMNVYVFDAGNQRWTSPIITGTAPTNSHTAVLAPNGYVIIYGGSRNSTIA
ncbi:7809_t:CDS:2, partial [Racocetra fulgida]